jgi:hypothetical protein
MCQYLSRSQSLVVSGLRFCSGREEVASGQSQWGSHCKLLIPRLRDASENTEAASLPSLTLIFGQQMVEIGLLNAAVRE